VDTQYTSTSRKRLLRALGARVRARRNALGLTLRALAKNAHVSERFLAALESGDGNISVARLADVAEALATSASDLLATKTAEPYAGVVALLGLRGAGKSTIGERLARSLGMVFYELDALVSRRAGMALPALFEMHGEAYFRRLEREALADLLAREEPCVLATSGSIVESAETFALLKNRTTTIWLKARASDHWDRVVAQGDVRPMRGRANAKSELRALLARRTPLYAQAHVTIDTAGSLDAATDRVLRALKKR